MMTNKAFVTGGSGFIGSNLVNRLLKEGYHVTVYDNFSTGQKDFLKQNADNPAMRVVVGDLLDKEKLTKEMNGHDIVFHLAANADVRRGIKDTSKDFEQNILCTYNVLEAVRKNNLKKIVFTSSAVVYGEPDAFPTPENYPLIQTSMYGASKASCESMIQAYCEYYDITCWIFRFVSFIGESYTHGVIFDFVKKLRKNPKELEILGDGKQKKSYLDVQDGVEAIILAVSKAKDRKNIFNIGNLEYVGVIKVADIICDELKLKDVTYRYTGGSRGWVGDSPFVHLDIRKIMNLGWNPKTSIEEGIRNTVRYLQAHPELFDARE